jgi:hypothetical protein
MHGATRFTSAAFQRGYLRFRPYLPSYGFLLPFGGQPSLLEASYAHWRILRPLRSAYSGFPETPLGLPRSARVRYHRGGLLLYRGEGVSSKLVSAPSFPLFPIITVSASYGDQMSRGLIRGSLAFTRPVFP